MRKWLWQVLLLLFLVFPSHVEALESVTLHLFYSETCPHCAQEKAFLKSIEEKYPNLTIALYEVTKNPENDQLLSKVKAALDCDNPYVPYTVIGTIGMTGYSENTASQIVHFIEKYSEEETRDIVTAIQNGETIEEPLLPPEEEETEENSNFVLPILGEVDAQKVSLPLMAVIIGLVDGFNPCAMWVLLFLISMLLGMKDRKRMWILGFTFLLTSALFYFLIMVSWLTIALSVTSIIWVRNLIAIVAIIGGGYQLYQAIRKQASGCTVVPVEKRKKVLYKIQKITKEKTFWLAFLGIIGLAISVNLVEFACSAGLPLIFTQILSFHDLSTSAYFFYIFLYIICFLFDDIVIFLIAMVTLEMTGFSTKYTKYSHFIGGIILLVIGILLLVNPGILMFGS